MEIYNRREAQQRMNELAKANKPFVFVISYDQKQAYIEEVVRIDTSEMLYAFPTINNIPTGEAASNTPV